MTSTIDALGHVTASTYNALGQDIDDYQGQAAVCPGTSWSFSNLTPNSALSYDVYVYSGAAQPGTVNVGSTTTGANDATAPSLGPGWHFVETVFLNTASTTSLTVTSTGGTVDGVALLQNVSQTVYAPDGEVAATRAECAVSHRALGWPRG